MDYHIHLLKLLQDFVSMHLKVKILLVHAHTMVLVLLLLQLAYSLVSMTKLVLLLVSKA